MVVNTHKHNTRLRGPVDQTNNSFAVLAEPAEDSGHGTGVPSENGSPLSFEQRMALIESQAKADREFFSKTKEKLSEHEDKIKAIKETGNVNKSKLTSLDENFKQLRLKVDTEMITTDSVKKLVQESVGEDALAAIVSKEKGNVDSRIEGIAKNVNDLQQDNTALRDLIELARSQVSDVQVKLKDSSSAGTKLGHSSPIGTVVCTGPWIRPTTRVLIASKLEGNKSLGDRMKDALRNFVLQGDSIQSASLLLSDIELALSSIFGADQTLPYYRDLDKNFRFDIHLIPDVGHMYHGAALMNYGILDKHLRARILDTEMVSPERCPETTKLLQRITHEKSGFELLRRILFHRNPTLGGLGKDAQAHAESFKPVADETIHSFMTRAHAAGDEINLMNDTTKQGHHLVGKVIDVLYEMSDHRMALRLNSPKEKWDDYRATMHDPTSTFDVTLEDISDILDRARIDVNKKIASTDAIEGFEPIVHRFHDRQQNDYHGGRGNHQGGRHDRRAHHSEQRNDRNGGHRNNGGGARRNDGRYGEQGRRMTNGHVNGLTMQAIAASGTDMRVDAKQLSEAFDKMGSVRFQSECKICKPQTLSDVAGLINHGTAGCPHLGPKFARNLAIRERSEQYGATHPPVSPDAAQKPKAAAATLPIMINETEEQYETCSEASFSDEEFDERVDGSDPEFFPEPAIQPTARAFSTSFPNEGMIRNREELQEAVL